MKPAPTTNPTTAAPTSAPDDHQPGLGRLLLRGVLKRFVDEHRRFQHEFRHGCGVVDQTGHLVRFRLELDVESCFTVRVRCGIHVRPALPRGDEVGRLSGGRTPVTGVTGLVSGVLTRADMAR